MATFSLKVLAEGQLQATKQTLYTVPASTTVIIGRIKLVNSDTLARTINLYVKPGSTSRRISPKDMSLGAGYMTADDDEMTLEAGDLIEGDASVANVVDFLIFGVEKT